MLEGVDILNGDPSGASSIEKDFWIGELQVRLHSEVGGMLSPEMCLLMADFNISKRLATILILLSSGRVLSRNYIAARTSCKPLEELSVNAGGLGPQVVVASIGELRKRLPSSIKIITIWGVGYQCAPETCARLKGFMSGQPAKLNQDTGA